MKSKTKSIFAAKVLVWLALVIFTAVSMAQQPSPTPKKSPEPQPTVDAGEDAGDYTVIGSIEFGYRGLSVDGDHNKYQSDLNYRAGPRLFDSTFLMKAKDGKGNLFDTLLVTSTGWGGDPNGNVRMSIEKPAWYRFDGTYRRFKYFRFLNSFANPNWVFSPASFSRPPNPITGEHGFDTRVQLGDFDLTILPKDERIRFNIGYSPERYNGPAFTNYHAGGNEFNLLSQIESKANDFRVGADGSVGPVNFSFLQGYRRFTDDSFIHLGPTPGINLNPAAASLTAFNRDQPTRGEVSYTRLSVQTLLARKLDLTGRIIYSKANTDFSSAENFTGRNWNPRITGFPPSPPAATPNILNLGQYILSGNVERPNTLADLAATYRATEKFRISNTFRVETFEIDGAATFSDFFSLTRGAITNTIGFTNRDVA